MGTVLFAACGAEWSSIIIEIISTHRRPPGSTLPKSWFQDLAPPMSDTASIKSLPRRLMGWVSGCDLGCYIFRTPTIPLPPSWKPPEQTSQSSDMGGGQMEKSGYASLVCRFGSIFGMSLAHTIQVHHKLPGPTHLGYALATLATLLFCRNGQFFLDPSAQPSRACTRGVHVQGNQSRVTQFPAAFQGTRR